jgi:hypothetical protein
VLEARRVLDEALEKQCNVVTRAQVLAAGMTDRNIRSRLRSGAWQRIFPGVYATFSGPSREPGGYGRRCSMRDRERC